jgi:hypothetical protein
MTRQTPRLLVSGCLVVLTLSAAGIVVSESLARRDVAAADEFQSLVRGLGLGSCVDLSQCGFSFDPRLERACSQVEGPVPAGFFLCSRHMGSATGCPPLPPSAHTQSEPEDHATSR